MTTERTIHNLSPEPPPFAAPVTESQKLLACIWRELFQRERIGLHDNFFDLGGHSLLAVQTLHLVEQRTGVRVPIRDLFTSHTVLTLATKIDELRQPDTVHARHAQPNLLQLHQGTSPMHLVLIHPGGGGGTLAAYRALLELVDTDPTIYGFSAIDFDGHSIPGTSVQEIAAHYLTQLRAVAPQNPCCLIGWSAGGLIAYEMACQMAAAGQPPAMLSLIDSKPLRRAGFSESDWRHEFNRCLRFIGWIDASASVTETEELPETQWLDGIHATISEEVSRENLSYVHNVFRVLQSACASWQAPDYPGEIALFVPTQQDPSTIDFWCRQTGSVVITTTQGDHDSMMSMPYVQSIASVINQRLHWVLVEQQA